jgi:hypothetical protein
MTDASDPEEAVDRHKRTSEPDLNRVQPGWGIFDRLGRRMGEVVERDDTSVVVARDPGSGDGTRLPMKLLADEHPEGRWATLTVSAGELERLHEPAGD